MPPLKYRELTVSLPEAWGEGSQLIVLSPRRDDFRPNFSATHEKAPKGQTVEAFGVAQKGLLHQLLPGFAVVREGMAKLGAISGYLLESTYVSGGASLVQLQLFTLSQGAAWTLTYTDLAERSKQARAAAEALFASAQLGASRAPGPAR